MEPGEEAGEPGQAPRGDPQADFEKFWSDHYQEFVWVLMSAHATLEDARDAVQGVIVRMLDKGAWPRLTNPRAWVREAVLHAYLDQRRGRQREGRTSQRLSRVVECVADDGLNVWEDRQWVEQMLRTLPPTQRRVMEMLLDDLSISEIAELLGKTRDTVRQNLAHARKRLRANLGQDYKIDPPDGQREITREY